MFRRKKRLLLKLIITICCAVLCIGLMLKATITSLELQRFITTSGRTEKGYALSVISGMKKDQHSKTSQKKSWFIPKNVSIPHGPGEKGEPFYLPPGLEVAKDLYKTNGFNALVSDFIALNRTLPDIRHPSCRSKKYLSLLPKVSIVIPFYNEHWSTLLRTVTSIINRSPQQLIEEIILVDDFSTKAQLKGPLDRYMSDHFAKVQIKRATKREGLIRARLLGAKAATGEVIVFLDSHTEANVDWLPPLLEPIAVDRKIVVCPFIDVIDFETLAYRAQDEGGRGAFDWELYYKRLPLLPEDLKQPAEPFKSPVMAGGLFAVDRSFFWELGGYDDGLDVWGGEQYELSFKIWLCGGQLLDAPCSRVGHIYRKFAPFPNPGLGDFVGRNYKRVAEIWMDEYKEYLYLRRPHYRNMDAGHLRKQKRLRKKLGCKSFKWYMENVAFDQPVKYPPIEPPDIAKGQIRNEVKNVCLDTGFGEQNEKVGLDLCLQNDTKILRDQNFVFSWHKDIRPLKRSLCFDVSTPEKGAPVLLWNCHGMQGNQLWNYNEETHQLVHLTTGNCLDCDFDRRKIFMNYCHNSSTSQKWRFAKMTTDMKKNDMS